MSRWDSPHNKALIEQMPALFACPSHPDFEPGHTGYRIVEGPGASFPGPEGIALNEIRDGSSMTIAVVESRETAGWTQPGGMPFDAGPDAKLPAFGSYHPGGYNVLMFDGSVRFLKDTIDPQVLRNLLTPAGGEVVGADDF